MATNNAINTGKPIEVTKGGTQAASFTAYAVICAGTTSTSALQNVSGVGTSGQALTSQGAGALPQWATAPTTNTSFPTMSSDPGSPTEGQVWFNTSSNAFKGYNGSVVTFTVT